MQVHETAQGPIAGEVSDFADLDVPAEIAFDLICAVEKWPVWLSLIDHARPADYTPRVALGSDIVLRSTRLRLDDHIFEVADLVAPHRLTIVDAFSERRRLEFRIEQRGERSRMTLRIGYPTYGGAIGRAYDRLFVKRNLETALAHALVHFKSLVEYEQRPEAMLGDL